MFQGATNYAESVDNVMLLIIAISAFLLLGITAAMIYFVFRYSRKRNPKATQIHGNIALEAIWIVIPTIIVMIMFWYGYKGYKDLRTDQNYAMKINVWAYMWGWDFEYPNGKKTDTLYIPVSQVTRLELESRDVNHSLYIPAFRLKEDVINGSKHFMMLTPKQTGTYDIACAEYCGLNHAYMYTKLYVMEDDEFDEWYNSTDDESESEEQVADSQDSLDQESNIADAETQISVEKEYNNKVTKSPDFQLLGAKGCIACHSTDGSKKIGPSFTELANGKVTIKDNGGTKEIEVTREYLKTSIMEPDKQIVEGYQKYTMPSSKGMVNEEELERIIDLLMPVQK